MEVTGEQLLPTDFRDYTRATPLSRFIARFIDRILAFLLGAAVGYTLSLFGETAGVVAGVITGFAYYFLKDAFPFLNGQSLGKKMLSIKVADANEGTGIEGNYGKALAREITTIIPLISLIDALMIFSNNQRLGDTIAHTIVVNMPAQ